MVDENKKIKILVVGDSGVGKSSIVHLLCYGSVLKDPRWTVGASPHVLIHTARNGESFWVELWDIGGASRFERARSMFYPGADGLLLVHDVTNSRSYANLKKWIKECSVALQPSSTQVRWEDQSGDGSFNDANVLQLALGNAGSVPVLILGNKQDEGAGPMSDSIFAAFTRGSSSSSSISSTSMLRDVESNSDQSNCLVSALNDRAFLPGTATRLTIDAFFERVYQSSHTKQQRLSSTVNLSSSSSSSSLLASPSSPSSPLSTPITPSRLMTSKGTSASSNLATISLSLIDDTRIDGLNKFD